MATDFFERQADARKSTTWLISMFCLAVVSICATVFVAATLAAARGNPEPLALIREDPSLLAIPLLATAITLLLIIGGTLYKVLELRHGGGTLVAERMGGKRVYPNTSHPVERRLLNVVEEMALASGTPVPPVFLIDEDGINAFAAGYSPSDAVLGVTRGCATLLSRDELQGVMAHEFSHILNGDMRMSIRLIGVLHGILLLGLTGQLLFRILYFSGHSRSRDRDKGSGQVMIAIFVLAVLLIILGFLGTFLGNLIKAAVSRQREYLADASAVQFTRNPKGLAGALKKIGGFARGSRIQSAAAAEASHMFFAKGVFEGFSGLWATHPKLENRIQAIDPDWNGEYPTVTPHAASTISDEGSMNFVGAVDDSSSATDEVPLDVVDDAVHQVGEPTQAHHHYAADLIADLPRFVLDAIHEPYGARAVLYALLLDRVDKTVRNTQLQTLAKLAQPDVVALVHQLSPIVDQLDVRVRLPIIDLSLPSLRAMCKSQYHEFANCFDALVKADSKIDLFEWMLSQVLIRHLKPQFETVRSPRITYYGLQKLGDDCSLLLSAIAYSGVAAGSPSAQSVASNAFHAAAQQLPDVPLALKPQAECGLGGLSDALRTLSTVAAKHRGRLVDACAAAICADEHVRWQEAELLRGISDLLDCPMPPLLVKRRPSASTPTAGPRI